jgi:hypothetical protein
MCEKCTRAWDEYEKAKQLAWNEYLKVAKSAWNELQETLRENHPEEARESR